MAKIEIHVISDKGAKETFHYGEEHTFEMVNDFLNDPEKLQRFADCMDENPVFAHYLYKGIPIPPVEPI